MRAEYHPFVRHDLKEIRDYYSATAGLGSDFIAEFNDAIRDMLSLGARTRPVHGDIRVVRLKRFPYGVYYRVSGSTAVVLVVKHLHRDPNFGLDRN